MKIDWKRKLTSRKLWLSIASFVSMLLIYSGHAESQATQVASLIMAGASIVGYVIGEGLADSKASESYPFSDSEIENSPDQEEVVSE